MGVGHAFPETYWLLFNSNDLYVYEDEDGEPIYEDYLWGEIFEDFYEGLCENLGLTYNKSKHDSRDAMYLAEEDKYYLGIRYNSNGEGCLFLEPKTYERGENEYFYNLSRVAERKFNKLIRQYGVGFWTYATSAYTSLAYKRSEKLIGKYQAPLFSSYKVKSGIVW